MLMCKWIYLVWGVCGLGTSGAGLEQTPYELQLLSLLPHIFRPEVTAWLQNSPLKHYPHFQQDNEPIMAEEAVCQISRGPCHFRIQSALVRAGHTVCGEQKWEEHNPA